MEQLTSFERRWSKYARKVLAQNCGCPCDNDDIAWPGYIGKNYARGRVLIVGAIHNAPVLRASGIYDIAPSVKNWLTSPESCTSDRAYLDMLSAAYKRAIPEWSKRTVWHNISVIVESLGQTFDEIAFTNLAKCGLPSGTSWSIEKRRMKAHDAATPISALVADLEPAYVLIAKDRSELSSVVDLANLPDSVRRCNNRTFVSQGVPRREWLPKDIAMYRSRIDTRSEV